MAKTTRTTKYPPMETGQRFGRLVAIEFVGKVHRSVPRWRFKCDCGAERTCQVYDVLRVKVPSCGCLRRENPGRAPSHGMRYTQEYNSWCHMLGRCTNPKHMYYSDYGGRGVEVCRKWSDNFEAFFSDVGPKPSPSHSIDRHPNKNGNYEPGNVRWATKKEQARNRRNTRMVSYRGTEMPLAEACEIAGANINTVAYRLTRGWSVDRAFS